ncbi:unnamed protein product [Ambrosiozyma monospora]|uniref:Unnamed protein product n=1 Tax=Ambrosiozyma monospora TaxID=43982 RepID=A0ACB5TW52_AMBMO|nr:unnamed protein product [Ambrosiozyma monospora]
MSKPTGARIGLSTSNNAYEGSRQINIANITKTATNSASKTMTMRTDPDKNYRSGLVTANAYNAANGQVNIANITKTANSSASRSMSMRTNPDKNYRSGLVTANAFNTANGQVNISKITSAAEQSAQKSITSRLSRPNNFYGIPTASDSVNNDSYASVGALASQNFDPKLDRAAEERATLAKNSLVENKVLLKAVQNANKTLDRLDTKISSETLFSNREMNIKAIQIAQANLARRRAENDGKIDVGSGMKMSADEIHRMAEALVKPVLADLNAKVALQQQSNEEKKRQQDELKQKRIQYFADKKAAKVALKEKRESEKVTRRLKLQEDQDALKQEQMEMSEAYDAKLAEKEEEYKKQIEEEEKAKHEVDTERDAKLQVLREEKEAKDAERQAEIDAIQKEKDEEKCQ